MNIKRCISIILIVLLVMTYTKVFASNFIDIGDSNTNSGSANITDVNGANTNSNSSNTNFINNNSSNTSSNSSNTNFIDSNSSNTNSNNSNTSTNSTENTEYLDREIEWDMFFIIEQGTIVKDAIDLIKKSDWLKNEMNNQAEKDQEIMRSSH